MNRRPSYTRMLAIVMMSGLVACAGVPTQEMSNARQALQAARAANADTHAPKSFSEAEQRLTKAERELSAHYYARARKDAVIARSDALTARNIALALAEARAAVTAAEAEGSVSPATRAWLSKAEPLLQEARQAEARMTPSQHDRLIDADAAFRLGQGRLAHDLAAALLADLKTVQA